MTIEIIVDGDVEGERLATLLESLDAANAAVVVKMTDADIDEAAAVATLAKAVRRTAARVGDLVIVDCPQTLAHTLYRVGALGSGVIRLVDPKEEIGTAG